MSDAQCATGGMVILCAYLIVNQISCVQRSEASCCKESHQKQRVGWVPCHQACADPAWQGHPSSMLRIGAFGAYAFQDSSKDREVHETHLGTRDDAPEHSRRRRGDCRESTK